MLIWPCHALSVFGSFFHQGWGHIQLLLPDLFGIGYSPLVTGIHFQSTWNKRLGRDCQSKPKTKTIISRMFPSSLTEWLFTVVFSFGAFPSQVFKYPAACKAVKASADFSGGAKPEVAEEPNGFVFRILIHGIQKGPLPKYPPYQIKNKTLLRPY